MIKSSFTNGYLSAVFPEAYPAVSLTDQIEVATSNMQDPREGKARSCFVFEKFEQDGNDGTHVHWGEKIYISINLPGLDQPVQFRFYISPFF